MIREEVLKSWSSLKEKINQVKLSPQDKVAYNFMSVSKTVNFMVYTANSLDLNQLNELEEDVKVEKARDIDFDNEIVGDYWLVWNNFGSLILDWINLKRLIDSYRLAFEEKDEEINELNSRSERIWKKNGKRMRKIREIMNDLKDNANCEINEPRLSKADILDIRFHSLKGIIDNFDYVEDIVEVSDDESD